MNLIPAEQWVARQFLPNCERTTVDFIRQIQANALRWAAERIKTDVNTPNSRDITVLANQLNPKSPNDSTALSR